MDYFSNPRNDLEREVILGQFLDVESLLIAISESGSKELFSDLYRLAMLRAFKAMELLNWSFRMLCLAYQCRTKQDFEALKQSSDVADNVAHHLSRLAGIYMEGARLIAARFIPGQNNRVNNRLDDFVSGVFIDPGSEFLLQGGAPADETFSHYLDENDPPPPLQSLGVTEPELLIELGIEETFPVMQFVDQE